MNHQQAIENFKNWQPKVLLVGIVDFKNGRWGLQSTLCSTKEEVYTAIKMYDSFDVYYIRKSPEGQSFYISEMIKFEEAIKSLNNDSRTND